VVDNPPKGELIQHETTVSKGTEVKAEDRKTSRLGMSLRPIMVVGGVMAHQALDG
jgi:hypothetical protein